MIAQPLIRPCLWDARGVVAVAEFHVHPKHRGTVEIKITPDKRLETHDTKSLPKIA
jgi:hypothetical protein